MNRRTFDGSARPRWPKPDASTSLAPNEWMPLADAARALHAAQRGSDLDRMSRGLSGSDEDLLSFWARRTAQVGVPVYGCRIMSTKLEVVPDAVMRDGKIIDHATRLDVRRGEPTQDFCDLRVKREDLAAHLARADQGNEPQT